jgi:TatD DNase family protein
MVTAGRLQEIKEALELVDKHGTTLISTLARSRVLMLLMLVALTRHWRTNTDRLYTTVGVHPTRCDEFEKWEGGAEDYLRQLLALALSDEGKPHPKIVAVGEFGLGT